MSELAVTGITVIDIYTGSKTVQDLLVKGEKIVQIGASGSLHISEETKVIDGSGQYAIPGLCDMHVHLTAWPEFKDQVSALFVAVGVTSVRDMGGKLEDILAFREKATKPEFVAPRLWIAGPIIDGSPPIMKEEPEYGLVDLSVAVDTPEEAKQLVDELVKEGVDFIKAYEMLRPEVFTALLEQAQSHKLQAAGHLPIRMTIPEVLSIGPYDIQHLGGVCSGMKYECVTNMEELLVDRVAVLDGCEEEHGVELAMKILNTIPVDTNDIDAARRASLIELFVDKGTWHTPTLVNSVGFKLLGFEKDSDWLSGFQYLPAERQEESLALRASSENKTDQDAWKQWKLETVGEMHRAGVKFLAGTDCPPLPTYAPGFGLHFELKAMVKAGLSPLEALQTATINPAEFFELTDELGSIEVNKYADLVLLGADPLIDINNTLRITSVISRGKFLSRNDLDDIFDGLSGFSCDDKEGTH